MIGREIRPLIGRKTVLFPFDMAADLDFFIDLHRKYASEMGYHGITDEEINSRVAVLLRQIQAGQMLIWTGKTNEGEKSRTLGFVYLSEIKDGHEASIDGLYDPKLVKIPRKRKGKPQVSHAEDAFGLVADFALGEMGLARIESEILSSNKGAKGVVERSGFDKEGVLKKKANIGGEFKDVIVYAKLAPEKSEPEEKENKEESQVKPESVSA